MISEHNQNILNKIIKRMKEYDILRLEYFQNKLKITVGTDEYNKTRKLLKNYIELLKELNIIDTSEEATILEQYYTQI